MSITAEQIDQLRALKGAPLSLLFALFLAGAPIGRDQLVIATGWGRDKVTEGLSVLQAKGLASPLMRYNGWELTARAHQLTIFEGEKTALDTPATTAPTHNLSLPTIKSSSSSEHEGEKIALANPAVFEELHLAGIGEPVASQLASLAHVTPQYIRAHTLKAREDRIQTGLLIHRIRSNDLQPELNDWGHLSTCNCSTCNRNTWQRYSNND